MITLIHVEKESSKQGKRPVEESIGWVLEGKAFVIRNKDKFTKTWVPMFFGQTKLSSFTRKLYRWGFRKLNLARDGTGSTQNSMYFGNENFQRDNTSLLSRMRSITAAKTRNEAALDSTHQTQAIAEIVGNNAHLSLPSNIASALEVLLGSIAQPMPTTNPPLRPDARTIETMLVMQQLGTLIENQHPHRQQSVPYSLVPTFHQGVPTAPPSLADAILSSRGSLTSMGFHGSPGLDPVPLLLGQLHQFNNPTQPIRPFPDQMQHPGATLQAIQTYLLSAQHAAQVSSAMPPSAPVAQQLLQSLNHELTHFNVEMPQSRTITAERDVVNEIINMLHRYNQSLDRHQHPPRPPY
jgi:HSF-type DNA-binding